MEAQILVFGEQGGNNDYNWNKPDKQTNLFKFV